MGRGRASRQRSKSGHAALSSEALSWLASKVRVLERRVAELSLRLVAAPAAGTPPPMLDIDTSIISIERYAISEFSSSASRSSSQLPLPRTPSLWLTPPCRDAVLPSVPPMPSLYLGGDPVRSIFVPGDLENGFLPSHFAVCKEDEDLPSGRSSAPGVPTLAIGTLVLSATAQRITLQTSPVATCPATSWRLLSYSDCAGPDIECAQVDLRSVPLMELASMCDCLSGSEDTLRCLSPSLQLSCMAGGLQATPRSGVQINDPAVFVNSGFMDLE